MTRPRLAMLVVSIAAAATFAAGCDNGGKPIANNRGAQLFHDRCSGCHSLKAAGAEGSVSAKESPASRPTGPNLNQRKENKDQVLYAIRNGGFSGAIMPQNVVVGKDAQEVADFVAEYAGTEAKSPPGPQSTGSSGATGSGK